MKNAKLFQVILVFLTLMTFQVGCQKEGPDIPAKPNNEKAGGGFLSSCGEPVPGNSVLELMVNPDDAEDTRVNYILYHYAQSVRKAVANPTKRCQIVNALLATPDGQGALPLLKYAQDNPTSIGNGLNADLKLSISAENVYPKGVEPGIDALVQDPNWDANSFLRNKTTYNSDESDEPVIYFVRAPESCDLNRDVIVVIGTDVDDCDDVAGWNGNQEIVMGEAEASSTSAIVIYVGLGQRSPSSSLQIKGNDIPVQALDNMISERANVHIDADEFRIKKRFENSKKSEIMGKWSYYDPSVGFVEANGIPDHFNKLKIHKDDIGSNGTLYDDDEDYFTIPNTNWSIQVAAYEHDWFSTSKDIKNNCIIPSDNDYNMGGKRKYSHEVYFNECVILSSTWFPSVGSTKSFDNDASYFKFKRRD